MDDATDDDTQSDDGGAIVTGVAEKLIALNPAAVIGPNGSAQVDTVWQLFQSRRMVEISGTATSVEFETLPDDAGPDDRYFFRTVPHGRRRRAREGPRPPPRSARVRAGAGGVAAPTGGPLPLPPDGRRRRRRRRMGVAATRGVVSTYLPDGGSSSTISNAYGIPMCPGLQGELPSGTIVATDQQIDEGKPTSRRR